MSESNSTYKMICTQQGLACLRPYDQNPCLKCKGSLVTCQGREQVHSKGDDLILKVSGISMPSDFCSIAQQSFPPVRVGSGFIDYNRENKHNQPCANDEPQTSTWVKHSSYKTSAHR